MIDQGFRLHGYRWVVLGVFMFINLTIQILWIVYAPITGPAAHFYGVADLQIGLLAMIFMVAFIPLAIPVGWAIDTYGFLKTVGVGTIIMGIFGVARGLAGPSYRLVVISTIGLAISQPFLLVAWTKVPAQWFPIEERATAVGLVTLAALVGTAVGMVLTPILINSVSISTVQLIYGSIAAFSAVLFLVYAREHPPTPPGPPGLPVRALMLDGLKHAFKVRDFLLCLVVSFIGLGLFNGVSTWIENIIRPRCFTPTDAGTLGAVILAGGLFGAVIIPRLSDKAHKPRKYLLLGIVLSIPGLIGLTYAISFWLLLVSAFVFGFFLIGINPIVLQYATEIAYPTPEGTSNAIIQLFGQASVIFVYVMEALKREDGSFTPSLLLAAGLLVVSAVVITQLREPQASERAATR